MPEPVQPATPRDFHGDVRRIHGMNRSASRSGRIRSRRGRTPRSREAPSPIRRCRPGHRAPPHRPRRTLSPGSTSPTGAPAGRPTRNGDVGPTYYIQTVNTSIGIFDKSSGARVAAFTFDSLFNTAATGTPCDNSNQGDPVALYDPIADRWIVADFAWSNYTSGAMYECMAVSKSGDPVTGGWYFYAWQVETGGKIPDYPKLGLWPDGIYMSANVFSTTVSGAFQNVQVWAFNRQEMEAGGTAHAVTFKLPRTVGGVSVSSLLPSNARVATGLPPAGRPNYFASVYGASGIHVWKFHVDWATTPTPPSPARPTSPSPSSTSARTLRRRRAATTSTRFPTG